MKQEQKYIIYGVVAVVVLGVVVWLGAKPSPDTIGSPTPTASAGASASASPAVSRVPSSVPAAAMPKSYSDAVNAYEGKRIQFDMYCQANPKSLVFKNGVSLMLDNRSGDARTVKIGGTPYYLAGYGWKIVTLSVASSKLPAHLDIDCGSAQNVSYILLEK